jgi:hypothetical protein
MIGDLDENFITYKELRDMMKAMTELLTKNQASTTTISTSTISYCILPSLPSLMVLIPINTLLGK